jgi:hypothetical protein
MGAQKGKGLRREKKGKGEERKQGHGASRRVWASE